MKTRNGFVSNSSSSSFVCAGFSIDESMLPDIVEKLWSSKDKVQEILALRNGPDKKRGCSHDESQAQFCSQCGAQTWIPIDVESIVQGRLNDMMWDLNGTDGISIYHGDEAPAANKVFIGKSLASISDYDIVCKDIDLSELAKSLDDLKAKLGTEAPTQLYAGSVYS